MPGLRRALIITRREVRDTLTDWRVMTPMLILALFFPLLLVAGMEAGLPYIDRIDTQQAREKAVIFGIMMAAFFPVSFSLVIALESYVGEKERNTLEALLATPVSDGELFVGKLIAVLVPPAGLSLVAVTVYTVALRLLLDMSVPLPFLALTVSLTSVEALAMVASAVVVSSHTASIKAANLLASFIIIPVAFAVQAQVMLVLTGFGEALWFFLAGFIVIAAMLCRMGIAVFKREEILTREGEDLNLRNVLSTIVRFWHSSPEDAAQAAGPERAALGRLSVRRLYVTDLPQLLRSSVVPIAVVSGVLAAACATGFIFSLIYPIPEPLTFMPGRLSSVAMADAFSEISAGGIFLHNLEVLAASAILSIFSFGVAGLVILLSAFLVLGYLAGEAVHLGLNPLPFFGALVLPHGIVEIPTVILAGTLNPRIGLALMAPPRGFSIGDSLMLSLVNWVKGAALFVPLLLLAAWVETAITPVVAVRLLGG